MSINLAEIQQKQDRLLANIAEQNRKAYEIFYSPTPGDVSLPQYDELGNLTAVTIPNRAKIRQQMWDDVGAAIGQMSRTFYVDAENGDDLNDGSSGAPFATIKKACDSVPTGGYGLIIFKGTVEMTDNVSLEHKTIELRIDGGAKFINRWYVPSGYDRACLHAFFMTNATLNIHLRQLSSDGEPSQLIIAENDTGKDKHAHYNTIAMVRGGSWVSSVGLMFYSKPDTDIVIINEGILAKRDDWNTLRPHINFYMAGHYDGNIVMKGAAKFVDYLSTTGSYNVALTGISILDADGNAIDPKSLAAGIVYDSDNRPRNIISNIVF